MDAKLQALKVPELKALLQAASLPVSGNKADLIARLLENPSATASLSEGEAAAPQEEAPAAAPAPATEAPAAADASAAAPTDAATNGSAPVTEAAPTTSAPPASTEAQAPQQSAEEAKEKQKASILEELQKRLRRLQKFSTGGENEQIEALEKQIARIERFGLSETDISGVGAAGGSVGRIGKELAANSSGASKKDAAPAAGAGKAAAAPEEKAKPAPPPVKQETVSPLPRTEQGTLGNLDRMLTSHIMFRAVQEEEKAARIARQEADEAAKKRRLERFGPVAPAAAPEKRKADEVEGGASTAAGADAVSSRAVPDVSKSRDPS